MRILKGQESLPDDSTLVQHNISDGGTVNIVIEPEKKIIVKLQFGLEKFSKTVKNSMSVKDLKQELINSDDFAFVHCDFNLLYLENPDKKVKLDTSLPLYYYKIDDGATILIEKTFLLVNIKRVGGETEWIKRMPKTATIADLKKVILKDICDKSVSNVSLYLNDELKVNDEDVLEDLVEYFDDMLYFVEDKCYKECKGVYYRGKKIAFIGVDENDSKEDLKLRARDQLCIPLRKIKAKKPPSENWSGSKYYIIKHE